MTDAIVRTVDVDEGKYGGLAQALNFAVGALIAHDTARGASVFAGIDVERLFAAIEMLDARRTHWRSPHSSRTCTWGSGHRRAGHGRRQRGPEGRADATADSEESIGAVVLTGRLVRV